MFLAFTLILWITVSAALHRSLSKNGYAAIPIMAGLMAMGLGSAGVLQLFQAPPMSQNGGYADTYYVVSIGYFLLNIAIFYVAAAVLALAILKLARGLPKRLLAPVFWVFHLGVAGVVLPTLLMRFVMPRRYVDYADTFNWLHLLDVLGPLLGFLGLVCLLALAAIALGQRVVYGRKT